MVSRFSFHEPDRKSVADKLLDGASRVKIEVWRMNNGRLMAEVEVKASVGPDPFADEPYGGQVDVEAENAKAMDFARDLLAGFAAGGKEGAA